MTSRADKLRRRQHRKEKKRRHSSHGGPPVLDLGSLRVIHNAPGQVKMSEVLMDLLEPELERCADLPALEKVFNLGVLAWNACLMEESARALMLHDFARGLPSDLREGFFEFVDLITLRKQELYPHLNRPIVGISLSMHGDKPRLDVMSGI